MTEAAPSQAAAPPPTTSPAPPPTTSPAPPPTAAPAPPPTTAAPASAPAADPDAAPAGATPEQTIEHLQKRVAGLREKLATREAPPESPDGYAFDLGAELKPYAETLAKDPVFKGIREQFHAAGVGPKQAQGIVSGVMEFLAKGGHLEAPFDPAKEMAALFPDVADEPTRKAQTTKLVNENVAFLDALKGHMSERALDFARSAQDRAGAVEFVRAMRELTRGGGPIVGGAPAAQALTRDQLAARHGDPKAQWGGPAYDPAFVAETARLYDELQARESGRRSA